MPKKVGIIGAGVAGLTAIKCALDEGLSPVCFEKADKIGGLWYYRDVVKEGDPSVYRSCTINSSKEMTCFSDFPIPKEFPNFISGSKFQEYLELYATNFKLHEYINFNKNVVKVERGDSFEENGRWLLVVCDLKTGETERANVDFLMICNGHFTEASIPRFPGLEKFTGRVLHTRDYKDFRGYEDKRVLVVGVGNSGADVACELSRHAKQVYISSRSGCYVIQRTAEFGVPFDQIALQRWIQCFPASLLRPIHYHRINFRYRHRDYGLSPNFKFDSGTITISDDLPVRILVGAISVKGNVKTFTETGVVFDDGSEIKDIDCVIFATGYNYSFPFLDKSTIKVDGRFSYLYKLMFPPNVPQNTLSVIGLVHPYGAVPPILEMQARLASRVFAGKTQLPPPAVMASEVERRKAFLKSRYVDSPRYHLQIYFIDYMDDLGFLIGCKPNLFRLFFADFKLWYRMVFGPAVPSQWRLVGPNKWPGARDVIMSVRERNMYPMQTRQSGQNEKDGLYDGWVSLLNYIIVFSLAVWCSNYVWTRF